MTISQTAEQLVLVVKGISEVLLALNLVGEDEPQPDEVQKAAIDDIPATSQQLPGYNVSTTGSSIV